MKRSLGLNSLYQILGQSLPILVGVVSMPLLISRLGQERFGVFAIVLVLSGFLTLLDLGIGRGVVRFSAIAIREKAWSQLSAVLLVSCAALGIFSLVMMGAGFVGLPYLAAHWFHTSDAMRQPLLDCLTMVLLTLPIIILTSVIRSYLEAHELFGTLNILAALSGILNYLLPLGVAFATSSVTLVTLTYVLVILGRFILTALLCWKVHAPIAAKPVFEAEYFRDFWRFLSWLTVANVIGVLIVYSDRALASGTFDLATLPYYTIPLDFISRSMIVANGLSGTLLPYFSKQSVDPASNGSLEKIYVVTSLAVTLLFTTLMGILPWLIGVWLGPAYRAASTAPAGYFVIGCAVATYNVVASSKVIAEGKSRLLAFMYMCELPLFVMSLYFAGKIFGFTGLAAVWAGRNVVEYGIFNYLLMRRRENRSSRLIRFLEFVLPAYFVSMLALHQLTDMLLRGPASVLLIVVFVLLQLNLLSATGSDTLKQTRVLRYLPFFRP